MNGNNDFGVSYSRISWLDKALTGHPNVVSTERNYDIFFHITRERGEDVRLVCLDEYACGVTRVREVLEAFPTANFIFVGGNWNGYTTEAKEFCLGAQLGLFNSQEITGALYRNEFWSYHKRDDEGNPIYSFNNQ